jgi:hypothetical protein
MYRAGGPPRALSRACGFAPQSRGGIRAGARKGARIVYRYWLNAARRVRLAKP